MSRSWYAFTAVTFWAMMIYGFVAMLRNDLVFIWQFAVIAIVSMFAFETLRNIFIVLFKMTEK